MFINDPLSKKELLYNLSIAENTIKQGNAAQIDVGFIEIFEEAIASLPKETEKKEIKRKFEQISCAIFSTFQADERPFIGKKTSLGEIAGQYARGFVKAGLELLSPYFTMSPTRGDGHCLFRAVGYGLVNYIEESSPAKIDELLKTLSSSVASLKIKSLSSKFSHVVELARSIHGKKRSAAEVMNSKEDSDRIVSFLRDLACEYNRKNSTDVFESYAAVTDANKEQYLANMKDMRKAELGGEPEIKALEKTLGIHLAICDTPAVGKKQLRPETLLKESQNKNAHTSLFLLYRPGHYDIAFPS